MRLTAIDLAFAYPGAAPLYTGLHFDVQGAALIALTGPSGSGKSTLLSVIGGWLIPSQGRLERSEVARLALVPQHPHGVPGRSALDHVALPMLARGYSRSRANIRALELLATLRLDQVAGRPYRMLSGGERQRMLLARALASEPDVLLVDEPTAQLDPAAATEVCDALIALRQSGACVFIATHDPRVVAICPTVIDLLDAPTLEPAAADDRRGTP